MSQNNFSSAKMGVEKNSRKKLDLRGGAGDERRRPCRRAAPRAAPRRRQTRRNPPPLAPPAPQRTARAGSAPGGRPRAPRLSWSAPGCLPLQRGRRARRRPRGRAWGRGHDRPAARLGERGRCDALWSSSFPVSRIGGSMEQKEKGEEGAPWSRRDPDGGRGRTCAVERRGEARRIKTPWAPRTWMGKKIDRRRRYVTVDLKLSIALS